ncbi:MAG: hypothetical protein IPH50_10290 [Rhodanobacteraceae bacterium]|nr:hypothetical protein [Rhodanobacteraceae bacterium]
MLNNKISAAIGGALLMLASTSAFADVTVTLSPVNPTISPVGANSAVITLVFNADGVASSHQGAVSFDDAQFDVTSLITVGAGAVCSVPVDEKWCGRCDHYVFASSRCRNPSGRGECLHVCVGPRWCGNRQYAIHILQPARRRAR